MEVKQVLSFAKERTEKDACVTNKELAICRESHSVGAVYVIRNNLVQSSGGKLL